MNESEQRSPRRRRPVRWLLWQLAAALLAFAVIEGLASCAFVARELVRRDPLAERLHTEYDSQLGWIHRPNVNVPDLYGPGIGLRTNDQRFRNDHEILPEVAENRVRIVCSGDSFTLGYGVSGENSWCGRLEQLDPRWEVVNMGQGGYGVDQAWLWYERDAKSLEHGVHVFAFITPDFWRMKYAHFFGYPKPLLELRDGRIEVANTPLPRAGSWSAWLARKRSVPAGLASVRLVRRLLGMPETVPAFTDAGDQDPRDLALAIFDTLDKQHERSGRRLVLVHLPTREDCSSAELSSEWRTLLRTEADARGWTYLDLVGIFQSLPAVEINALYLQAGQVAHPSAAGHYSVAGNELVARKIHDLLLESPPDDAPGARELP